MAKSTTELNEKERALILENQLRLGKKLIKTATNPHPMEHVHIISKEMERLQ